MTDLKTKRIAIRINPEDDAVIRAAAARESVSVTDFLVESALVRAQIAMADRTHVELDPVDWEEFTRALDAPAEINDRLARTIEDARAVTS
jgi:uncharacterized protein (DUF1778 family)